MRLLKARHEGTEARRHEGTKARSDEATKARRHEGRRDVKDRLRGTHAGATARGTGREPAGSRYHRRRGMVGGEGSEDQGNVADVSWFGDVSQVVVVSCMQ